MPIRLAVGTQHSCALLDDGSARCWGDNSFGQLGTGDNIASILPRSVASTGGSFVEMSSQADHTCALLTDDRVSCWGGNAAGQLGDGTTTDSNEPRLVQGL